MTTYSYELVTDRYTASGEIDADDEAAAEKLLRHQVANPRKSSGIVIDDAKEVDPPTVKSIKLTVKTSA